MSTKPWQVVGLSTLCFIQAVYLVSVVTGKAVKSDPYLAVEAQAKLELASEGGADVAAIYDLLATSQFVFSVIAVVAFMLGFLLYRGEHLPGVRLTGAIFFGVGMLGQIFGRIPSGPSSVPDRAELLSLGLFALLFVGFVSLFFGKAAIWVNEHPRSA